MPTYEYHCRACEADFEVFQSIKAEPLNRCELCGAEGQVKRKIGTGAGLIFKGSGFYETDYKRSSGGQSGGGAASTGGEKSGGAPASPGGAGGSTTPAAGAGSTPAGGPAKT